MGDVLFPGIDDVAEVTVHTHGTEGDMPLHVVAWRGDTPAELAAIQGGEMGTMFKQHAGVQQAVPADRAKPRSS